MEQLYKMHNRSIYKYIFYLTQDPMLAEDLLQETFLRAWKQTTYKKQANELTWLRIIARNLVYDHFRRKRLIQFITFAKEHDRPASNSSLDYILQDEQRKALYTALATLSVQHREVLLLRKIEKCSIAETAIILNCSEDQVKNRQKAALQKLRIVWKEEKENEE